MSEIINTFTDISRNRRTLEVPTKNHEKQLPNNMKCLLKYKKVYESIDLKLQKKKQEFLSQMNLNQDIRK